MASVPLWEHVDQYLEPVVHVCVDLIVQPHQVGAVVGLLSQMLLIVTDATVRVAPRANVKTLVVFVIDLDKM